MRDEHESGGELTGQSYPVEVRYHVPRSQVWEGSRGRQSGGLHLHVAEAVTLTAKRGRCGTLARGAGASLCGKRGWYEHTEDRPDALRCSECVRRAARYGVEWPEVAHVA